MPFQIVPPDTRIDFVGHWRLCAAVSLVAIAVCAAAVPLRGIRLGVDFAGGYQVVVRVPGGAQDAAVRAAVARAGIERVDVVRVGEPGEGLFHLGFRADPSPTPDDLVPILAAELEQSVGPTRVEGVDFVGPRVGRELREAAFWSLGIAFLLILGYVGARFAPAYAPGAIVALVHDVLVTAGVFVLFGWEFDLNLVAALLTIVGYSVNDTIVIYDRIRENRLRRTGADLADVINQSVNETLSRTVLTAGSTLLAILALLALGGPELRGFAAAMAIGIVAGTWSSVYVAAPMVMLLDRYRPERTPTRTEPRRPSRKAA